MQWKGYSILCYNLVLSASSLCFSSFPVICILLVIFRTFLLLVFSWCFSVSNLSLKKTTSSTSRCSLVDYVVNLIFFFFCFFSEATYPDRVYRVDVAQVSNVFCIVSFVSFNALTLTSFFFNLFISSLFSSGENLQCSGYSRGWNIYCRLKGWFDKVRNSLDSHYKSQSMKVTYLTCINTLFSNIFRFFFLVIKLSCKHYPLLKEHLFLISKICYDT